MKCLVRAVRLRTGLPDHLKSRRAPVLTTDISADGKAHEWPIYDLKDRYVMVFDEFNIHSEKEAKKKILDWDRTYFLTKYYCI